MSWKIHNGFKLKDASSLEEALSFGKTLVHPFAQYADEYWNKLVIAHAIAELDNDAVDEVRQKRNYLRISENIFWEKECESSKDNTKSITNTSMEVSFTTARIKNKHCVIGILVCDNQQLNKQFFELERIDDYSYWNNTDRPEEVSAKDWDYRGAIWKQVFNQHGIIGKSMLTYNVITELEARNRKRLSEEKDIAKYKPSWQDRVKGALNHVVLRGKAMGTDFKEVSELVNFLHSDEADAIRKNHEQLVFDRLKLDITLQDLTLREE